MKITKVEALHLRLPQVHEIADGTQETLIVRVHTDAGLVGHGEVVSCAAVAKAVIEAPRSAARRHGLGVVLEGADPLDPPARWAEMYDATRIYGRQGVVLHAISGVDIALWDIVGQAAGKPLSAIWGRRRDRVRAYASTLFPNEPRAAAEMTEHFARQSFRAIKFGWGSFGADRAHDLALMRAIHGARDGMEVMVDVGRCWTVQQTTQRGSELFERYGITWLEDALHEDELESYAAVTRAVPGRLAAGEMEATIRPFQRLLEQGVKVVQPDAGRAGGLTVCREVSRLATDAGAWCVPHCFGTGVLFLASLQWIASVEEAPFMEYPVTASSLRNELVAEWPCPIDGYVPIPVAPGIGATLNQATIDRYRVA